VDRFVKDEHYGLNYGQKSFIKLVPGGNTAQRVVVVPVSKLMCPEINVLGRFHFVTDKSMNKLERLSMARASHSRLEPEAGSLPFFTNITLGWTLPRLFGLFISDRKERF
jgi:hypothetical protein